MSFFWRNLNNGEVTHLVEKHYGHVDKFDYVGNRIYVRHISTRLNKYIDWYKEAAEKYDLDWKLLAAMGYQESHWNPRAVSPTGVRGIMMLTQQTAGQLGIKIGSIQKAAFLVALNTWIKFADVFQMKLPNPTEHGSLWQHIM